MGHGLRRKRCVVLAWALWALVCMCVRVCMCVYGCFCAAAGCAVNAVLCIAGFGPQRVQKRAFACVCVGGCGEGGAP